LRESGRQHQILPMQVVRQGLGTRLQSPPSHDHQALQADHPHLPVLPETVSEPVRAPESHLPESLFEEYAFRRLSRNELIKTQKILF
jgi:hypothetical protein